MSDLSGDHIIPARTRRQAALSTVEESPQMDISRENLAENSQAPTGTSAQGESPPENNNTDRELATLRTQLLSLTAELNSLEQNRSRGLQARAPSPLLELARDSTVGNSLRQPKRKVADLDTFTGDARKFRQFIVQCQTAVIINSQLYPTHEDKILFVGSYLQGNAGEWWTSFAPRVLDPLADSPTYEEFLSELKQNFGQSDESFLANRKLRQLRQTTSVTEYTTRFLTLLSDLDLTEESKVLQFQEGLKTDVRRAILGMIPCPDTLSKTIEYATIFDNCFQVHSIETPRWDNYSRETMQRKSPNTDKCSSPKQHNPDNKRHDRKPPTLDLAPGKKIPPEERQRRIDTKSCLYCGEKDHVVANCLNKKPDYSSKPNPKTKKIDVSAVF